MPVTIEIQGVRATISKYKWKSDNKVIQRGLNLSLDPFGPSGSDPNPDLTAAMEVINTLNAKLIDFDEEPFTAGVVY